jgi:CBS domain containing-hemolysin-like protein
VEPFATVAIAAGATLDALAVGSTSWLSPEILGRLVLQGFLLIGSAFFSSSETALFSLSQLDLQKLRHDADPRTNMLYRLLEQPRRLIISVLCGNELINVAAAANMAAILVAVYGVDKAQWINVLVMVPLLLLLGEVTPKTIAVNDPVRFSTRVVAGPLNLWVWLITPLRVLIRAVSDRVATWIVGEEKAPENLLRIDEFRSLVGEAEEQGGVSATERTLLYNILAAGSTEIVEIMTPRTRASFVDGDLSLPDIMERVRLSRHRRLPVYRGDRDHILGVLNAEDFLAFTVGDQDIGHATLEELLHPVVVVPPTKLVDEMFDFFQQNRAQAAVVINEFGGVDGVVTLRDVLRFIFGRLAGQTAGQELYEERDQDSYEVPGDMKLGDFQRLTHFAINDPRMTTVGGFLYRLLDRLPQVGDSVTFEGIHMEVLTMDGHRIGSIRAARGKDEPGPGERTDPSPSAGDDQNPGGGPA